jgi:hypothetical protein
MDPKLKKKLENILKKHKNDNNPPKYVQSIEELIELECKKDKGEY